ncbi:beta family protein [Shewanella electrodiphila]|uniref:Beta family protein n=1 Tax=Shewanella electrodiphila TaxID=934143 RepID=A0ABT0KT27_9GAMM|nr:beta family protein [Shewanella electrodiphila]MCL1047012.1 beta family protein [Shewanella electrodiphila]
MDYKPYLPVLKWRQGEYQALMRLKSSVKSSIRPLFVIPPIEFDFETQMPKKTAQAHIEPLVKRLEDKWGDGIASMDLHVSLHTSTMQSGELVPEYVYRLLKQSKTNIKPVITLHDEPEYIRIIMDYCRAKACGLDIRIKFEELADAENMALLPKLIIENNLNMAGIEIIIDFGSKSEYEPFERIGTLLAVLISKIDSFSSYKSIYLVGTALDFSSVPTNSLVTQPRADWKFYRRFYKENFERISNLGFGDFSIEPPEFAPALDMRVIKPAARIIYSTEELWVINKGSAFRDNPKQMHSMCHDFVCKSGFYVGSSLSEGDLKIHECAYYLCSNGSLTTWKEVGTSHHISFVVHQLASLHGQ